MSVETMYRIGPVSRPTESQDLACVDMATAFTAAHRRWPTEPLFCRERDVKAPAATPRIALPWAGEQCSAPLMVLSLN